MGKGVRSKVEDRGEDEMGVLGFEVRIWDTRSGCE